MMLKKMVKKDGWIKFESTSIWSHYRLFDDEKYDKEKIIRCETFEELKDNIKFLYNAELTETLFTKKPMIKISTANFPNDTVIKVTEKNFKPFEIKIKLRECSHLTLSDLANSLSADDFVTYLKDRGIETSKIFYE